ncbi:hypothetical protein EYF80_030328 [Liparis tanakae]|uniref:Uncharacterized protein n=1 Tax=Liparis tanakae TaxID=230148 RepID=A0A4Z2H2U6_9TELE|nr:hypothetical protein EYF80_030328 [Liparis tanakae]
MLCFSTLRGTSENTKHLFFETAVELEVRCSRVLWSRRSSLGNASLQMSEGEPIQMRSKVKTTPSSTRSCDSK